MSGSSKCHHPEIDFNLEHAIFKDTNIRYLEIIGKCKICETPIQFQGNFPVGVTPDFPTQVELGNRNIVLPFLVEGEIYDGNSPSFYVKDPEIEN